ENLRVPETHAACLMARARRLAAIACADAAMGESRFSAREVLQAALGASSAAVLWTRGKSTGGGRAEEGALGGIPGSGAGVLPADAALESARNNKVLFTAYHQQVEVLRDLLVHSPRPDRVDPAWLTWNNGTVVKLAAAIYDQRNWDAMPVLADALQDAGCTDQDLLLHLRGPGPHVRGCWALD